MRFSANLGLLWTDLPMPAAIRAAARAGFDAVECHYPYDIPPKDIRAALDQTGLPMLSLNTPRGDVTAGEMGLAALPGRAADARDSISRAIDYANAIGATHVHVLAGCTDPQDFDAEQLFHANLTWACDRAALLGLTILIEPLNARDVPGYFLRNTYQACAVIDAVARPNLKLMFDCYHVGLTEGDILPRFHALRPHIGHIQFAGLPHRGPPDTSTVDLKPVLHAIKDAGWAQAFGAEYHPDGPTDASLAWRAQY